MTPVAPGREDRTAYREFLAAKAQLAPVTGFEVDPADVRPVLKPHQRARGAAW